MPYKTGKLKGELTTAEIRALIRAHNKASKITIPTGSSRDDIIKLLSSKGFRVDHKNQKLIQSAQAQKQLSIQQAKEINKPKPKTALQKQKTMERKQMKEQAEKKKARVIRKKAVEEEKTRQKKKAPVKKKTTTTSTQTSTDKPKPKPDPKLKTDFLKLLDQNKNLLGPNIYKQFKGDAEKRNADFKDLLPRLRYVITRQKQEKIKPAPKKDVPPPATKGFIKDGVVILPNPVRAVNPRAPETLKIKTAKQYNGTIDKLERLDGTYDEQSKNMAFKKILDSIKTDRIIRLVKSLNDKSKADAEKKAEPKKAESKTDKDEIIKLWREVLNPKLREAYKNDDKVLMKKLYNKSILTLAKYMAEVDVTAVPSADKSRLVASYKRMLNKPGNSNARLIRGYGEGKIPKDKILFKRVDITDLFK